MATPDDDPQSPAPWRAWLLLLLGLYSLLIAVADLGAGFQMAAGDRAAALFGLATNPFFGLVVGLLATALLQSSSATTSITVGLVAGGLPVATAVPIVMGANIGTTVTNTLVSLGFVGDRAEFRRAFAAATVHDCFNLLAVAIFLPLELGLHLLERLATAGAAAIAGQSFGNLASWNPLAVLVKPWVIWSERAASHLPDPWPGLALILGGGVLLAIAVLNLSRLLKRLLVGRAEAILQAALARGPLASLAAGAAIAAVIQSSSATTSLLVPLAGADALSLTAIYPVTLGANLGTCVTALLAATAVTGAGASAALAIALVHLLFNGLAIATIYGLPLLRQLPLQAARGLAFVASERRALALVYLLGVFFLLPGLLLGATAWR